LGLEVVVHLPNVRPTLPIIFWVFKILILIYFFSGAARALIDIEGLSAKDIALKSMKIAADKCVYTNHNWICETLNWLPSEI
jgi:hypothetical protein